MVSFLLLTNKCNLNCSFCFNNRYPIKKNKKELLGEDWLKIINILGKNNIRELILSGGEPLLLEKDLYNLIEEAKKFEIKTLLLTNGILLNEKRLEALKEVKLDEITISLNEITFIKDNTEIEKVLLEKIKLIELVLKYFEYISITILLSNFNYKYINKILNFFKNQNVGIIIQPVFDNNLGLFNLKPEDWSELKYQLSDWTIKYEKYNYVQMIYNLCNKVNDYNNPTCFMGNSSFVIDWYGEVIPCFHQPEKICGNILTHKINEIFLNLLYNSEKNIEGKCFGLHCISLFFNQI